MEIYPTGSRPTRTANPDYFTGTVRQDPIQSDPQSPARAMSLRVSFDPGARTAWHTHPLGQTLFVLSGRGLVGVRGAAPQVIRPGDTVWIPPGEEHWHGAGPETAMVHIAIQEADETGAAHWLEKVSDEDYLRTPE